MRPVRLWIGLVLLTLGVFGILDATGVLAAGSTIDLWWPVAIIGLGLTAMLAQQRISFWPLVITGLGVILLADQQNWATGDLVGPAILILIGGAVLAGLPGTAPPVISTGVSPSPCSVARRRWTAPSTSTTPT